MKVVIVTYEDDSEVQGAVIANDGSSMVARLQAADTEGLFVISEYEAESFIDVRDFITSDNKRHKEDFPNG